ncbi:AGAP012352-PA-like protein [Anopheles sinensis]|uniref:AGAP012352-PA-like protein n=1 Tax=Anopheles sinensis TaxID=74873 RepID=A0A084VI83_ANOSI|nr:AGAP012352-PA-like protein [Anopheles sinensis]
MTLKIDFTPEFAADQLTGDFFWVKSTTDIPLLPDKDACKRTTCPTEEGKKQTYELNFLIKNTFIPTLYDIKWKLTSVNGDTCCLIVQGNIVDQSKRT